MTMILVFLEVPAVGSAVNRVNAESTPKCWICRRTEPKVLTPTPASSPWIRRGFGRKQHFGVLQLQTPKAFNEEVDPLFAQAGLCFVLPATIIQRSHHVAKKHFYTPSRYQNPSPTDLGVSQKSRAPTLDPKYGILHVRTPKWHPQFTGTAI